MEFWRFSGGSIIPSSHAQAEWGGGEDGLRGTGHSNQSLKALVLSNPSSDTQWLCDLGQVSWPLGASISCHITQRNN